MATLKGSKTESNLLKAFAGESQARNRYNMFASQARKESFLQIADIFDQTAEQERLHAKRFFSFLEGGDVEITASFPAGKVGTTAENLLASSAGEHHEWYSMYKEFSDTAKAEGFNDVAAAFNAVSVAEKHHEDRYLALLELVKAGKVQERDGETVWLCTKCGYLHKGKTPPNKCAACHHPKEYFVVLSENY